MEQPSESGADDQDRVVSRRVDHPTNADEQDEAVYEAADPAPDGDASTPSEPAGPGSGESEQAAAEVENSDGGEPTRSE